LTSIAEAMSFPVDAIAIDDFYAFITHTHRERERRKEE